MFCLLKHNFPVIIAMMTFPLFARLSTNIAFVDEGYLPPLLHEESLILQNLLQLHQDNAAHKGAIIIVAVLPIRCSDCKQVFRNLQTAINCEDIAPLMTCFAISRWQHCLLHKFRSKKQQENSCFPYFLAIHTEKNRQLLQYELTNGHGFREDFLEQVLIAACL